MRCYALGGGQLRLMPTPDKTPRKVRRGAALRKIRKDLGMSTAEVSALLGVSKSGYEHWESGVTDLDRVKERALSQALGVRFDALVSALAAPVLKAPMDADPVFRRRDAVDRAASRPAYRPAEPTHRRRQTPAAASR
jgi:transcriptional regulator with XRE-family HTH domain